MQWRIEDSQPPVWEHTNSMMSAWKSEIRDGTRNPTMKIPSLQVNVIKELLGLALGGGVYVVQASWSMEDHGSVRRVSLGGR
jgi:hypothetical protein